MDVMFGEGFVKGGRGKGLGRKVGNTGGKGGRGACGGTRRKDGSGGGVGNIGTPKQPPKKKK